jgi:hypothetical protein
VLEKTRQGPDLCLRGHDPMYRTRSTLERPTLKEGIRFVLERDDDSFSLQHTGNYTIKQSCNKTWIIPKQEVDNNNPGVETWPD